MDTPAANAVTSIELTERMRTMFRDRLLVDPVSREGVLALLEGRGVTGVFRLDIDAARLTWQASPDPGAPPPPADTVASNGHTEQQQEAAHGTG